MADFVPNFVAMATRVGRSRIFWRQSIARPQKPLGTLKDLVDISDIGRVIPDFVRNFVAMATGVRRSKICLASLNSPTPKTPSYAKISWISLI